MWHAAFVCYSPKRQALASSISSSMKPQPCFLLASTISPSSLCKINPNPNHPCLRAQHLHWSSTSQLLVAPNNKIAAEYCGHVHPHFPIRSNKGYCCIPQNLKITIRTPKNKAVSGIQTLHSSAINSLRSSKPNYSVASSMQSWTVLNPQPQMSSVIIVEDQISSVMGILKALERQTPSHTHKYRKTFQMRKMPRNIKFSM